LVVSHKPQVSLVDQGGGLERLAGLLAGEPLGGRLAELVVDQGEELLDRPRVTVLDGRQNARDVGYLGSLPRGERLVSLGVDRSFARVGLIDDALER
jgi:hypothetical protein